MLCCLLLITQWIMLCTLRVQHSTLKMPASAYKENQRKTVLCLSLIHNRWPCQASPIFPTFIFSISQLLLVSLFASSALCYHLSSLYKIKYKVTNGELNGKSREGKSQTYLHIWFIRKGVHS